MEKDSIIPLFCLFQEFCDFGKASNSVRYHKRQDNFKYLIHFRVIHQQRLNPYRLCISLQGRSTIASSIKSQVFRSSPI